MDCGEPVAVSVMATDAEREPVAFGENLTETVHFAFIPRLVPQVVLSLKSAAFVPAIAILLMDNAAVPGFDTVTV